MFTQIVQKGLFAARQISPTALTTVGVVGVVTAGVLACRATLKAAPKIQEISDNLELMDEMSSPENDPKLVAREKAKILGQGAGELVRLYAIPVTLGVVSIVAIVGGHRVMLKRNAALASALTLTEQAFKKYRKAVAAEIGEEREKELRYATSIEQISDTKAGTVTETVTARPNEHSQYARFFDQTNSLWENNAAYNKVFLEAQQNYANQLLRVKGFLLLNEVYKSLGFEPTTAGAVVGWAIGNGGDDFVDFGIYDPSNEQGRMFVNGDEKAILLDFNVDGVVYNLIGDGR